MQTVWIAKKKKNQKERPTELAHIIRVDTEAQIYPIRGGMIWPWHRRKAVAHHKNEDSKLLAPCPSTTANLPSFIHGHSQTTSKEKRRFRRN
jgi:hypothetical protein